MRIWIPPALALFAIALVLLLSACSGNGGY
jgi:hypothetical protein